MKKSLFAIILAICTITAWAGGLDTRSVDSAGWGNLTETQKTALLQQIAAQSKSKDTVDPSTIDKIDKVVEIGAKLGQGLAVTAKELGIAANEFAVSPLGKLATVLIVWHVVGTSIVHIFGALVIWVVGLMAIRSLKNSINRTEITYDETKVNKFGNHPKVKIFKPAMNGEQMAGFGLMYAVVVGLGSIALFTM